MSELGVFGYLLADAKEGRVLRNQTGGHFLRTKAEDMNEGGVAIGAGVVDSPLLT